MLMYRHISVTMKRRTAVMIVLVFLICCFCQWTTWHTREAWPPFCIRDWRFCEERTSTTYTLKIDMEPKRLPNWKKKEHHLPRSFWGSILMFQGVCFLVTRSCLGPHSSTSSTPTCFPGSNHYWPREQGLQVDTMAGQLPPEIRISVKELRFFVEYLWLEHFKDRMCPIPVPPIPLFFQILCWPHKKGPQDATRRQQYGIIIYMFFCRFQDAKNNRLPTNTYLVGCCTISYGTSCLFMKDLGGRKAGRGIRRKSSCNGAIEAFNNPFGDKIATGSFDRMARLCRGGMGLNWRPFVVGLSVFWRGMGNDVDVDVDLPVSVAWLLLFPGWF